MKKLLTLTSIVSAMAILALVAGCQTMATNSSEIASSKKENLLAQAGFKTKTVTTPKQQQRVSQLAQGRVWAVKYNGKLYYVYPTATKDRILVGNQTQYNAYKQALVAYGLTTSPSFVEETHGPHRVLVQQFDGFGPLGE